MEGGNDVRIKRRWPTGCFRYLVRDFVLLVALLLGASTSLAAPRLTAALDRNTITVGEYATLSLTFEGGSPEQPPAVRAPANVVVNYLGQSSNFSMINGQVTSSITLNYRVTATQPGSYVIPQIQVAVGGQTLTSQAFGLRVLKPSASPVGPGGTLQPAFAKLVVPKTTVYVGEAFPVEIQLYVANRHELNMPQLKADGFTLGTMTQPTRGQAQISNLIYEVFTFRVAAVAAKTGSLALGPAECNLQIRIRRPNDPLDPIGGLFGGVEVRALTVYGPSQTMEVLPLPQENRPESFTGAVGSFNIAVSASPTNAAVGDPITLKIQIAGNGALDSLALPSLSHWKEFTVYPPTSKVEPTDALGLSGVKSFEEVVIPQNSQIKLLPAVAFSFFDPDQKAYRTVQHPPIAVSIRPSTAAAPHPTVSANSISAEPPPPTRDIVQIKPHLGSITGFRPLLIQQPWFLALQTLPFAAWLAAFLWRKQLERMAKDPRLRRRRFVLQIVRKGLTDLRHQASANQAEEFFATVFRLLQEQLGERLDLPAGAITESVVDEQLRQRGVPEDLLAEIHRLFAACNEARYARFKTAQELESLVPSVESVLQRLQEHKAALP